MINPITIWERYNHRAERFEHNHIEDGWNFYYKAPQPFCKVQKQGWKNQRWRNWFGVLKGHKVYNWELRAKGIK